MSYGEVFSSINDKLENLSNIIDEIKSALYDIYVDTEEDEFMAVINNLYNKGSEEDPKDFLGANFKAFPTSTGLIGINEKIEYYGELKLAIFNTLRALGVDIANDAGFSNYASLIRSFEVPENKYLPVSDVITEGVTTTTTRLLLAAEEGYSYLYLNTKYIPKYGDSYEDLLDAGFVRFYGDEEVYVDRNNRYLVIIKAKGETCPSRASQPALFRPFPAALQVLQTRVLLLSELKVPCRHAFQLGHIPHIPATGIHAVLAYTYRARSEPDTAVCQYGFLRLVEHTVPDAYDRYVPAELSVCKTDAGRKKAERKSQNMADVYPYPELRHSRSVQIFQLLCRKPYATASSVRHEG